MKVVYFPYTAIDPRKAARMARIWGPLGLLQPSLDVRLPATQKLQEDGHVQMILPSGDAAPPIGDLLNEFKQWAAQHAGGDLAAMIEKGQTIPFFSNQSSSQIVAEIRKEDRLTTEKTPDDTGHMLLLSRLLLAMAQEWDDHQKELDKGIKAVDAQEKEMMALLRGEEEIDAGSGPFPATSAWQTPDQMIPLRLKAWARVMASTGEALTAPAGPETELLFLTDNPGVLAQVLDMFPEAHYRLQGYRMSAGRRLPDEARALPVWLAEALSGDTPPGQEELADAVPLLDLVEIPRIPAGAFPLCLLQRGRQALADRFPLDAPGSCWVGCMTIPGNAD